MKNLDIKFNIKKGEWLDADYRMFVACFTILGQFVENELGKGREYKGYRLHCVGDTDKKAIDLWIWYKKFKNKKYPEYDGELSDEKFDELMKIRHTLWT